MYLLMVHREIKTQSELDLNTKVMALGASFEGGHWI
jgi:hypothetical protein